MPKRIAYKFEVSKFLVESAEEIFKLGLLDKMEECLKFASENDPIAHVAHLRTLGRDEELTQILNEYKESDPVTYWKQLKFLGRDEESQDYAFEEC